jgi:hypothetical protein
MHDTSESLRVDTSGRLLVGTSSTSGNGCLIQSRNDSTGLALELQRSSDNASAAALFLTKSRGTQGSPTEVSNGDQLGVIAFSGHDGAGYKDAAYIIAEADGTWTDGGDTTDNPGRLVFSTTADGAASPTERMRINSAGQITMGSSAINFLQTLNLATGQLGTSVGLLTLGTGNNNTNGRYVEFQASGGGVIGSITQSSASAVAYNTSSDYRLKENVTAVTDGIARIQQLKPSRFNFIADPDKTVDGFIAHEVQNVVPEAIAGEKDAVDADGNPVYQGIDQSKLVPLLTAALQEAIAKIEALETRLSALEGK